MSVNRLGEVFIKVKDFELQVKFYEDLFGCKAITRYSDRWATIQQGFGLYNPQFDIEHGVPLDKFDTEIISNGNNIIMSFRSDNLEESREQLKNIGATFVGNIYEVNFMALFRYFHFQDPEGNVLEIGKFE